MSESWSLFASTEAVLFKVWGPWFVGDGVAYRLEDDVLVPHQPPDDEQLLTVRGSSDDDVWAVGGRSAPAVLHFHDGAWEKIATDPKCLSQPLSGVWTGAGEDVWVAGHFGTAARYAAGAWSCADLPITSEHFHAAWKHDEEVLWAGGNLFSSGGNYGTIGRFSDTPIGSVEVTECAD